LEEKRGKTHRGLFYLEDLNCFKLIGKRKEEIETPFTRRGAILLNSVETKNKHTIILKY